MSNENQAGDAERLSAAAQDVVQILISALSTERGVHSETIIGAAAALTGEQVIIASGSPFPQSTWTVGNPINALIFETPDALWPIIHKAAIDAGARKDQLPTPALAAIAATAAINTPNYPQLTVPRAHFPQMWSPLICPMLRQVITMTAEKHRLSPYQMLLALAMAVGVLLLQTAQALPPHIGATLALEIISGVARMPTVTPQQAEEIVSESKKQ